MKSSAAHTRDANVCAPLRAVNVEAAPGPRAPAPRNVSMVSVWSLTWCNVVDDQNALARPTKPAPEGICPP